MKNALLGLVGITTLMLASGCSAGRDVEVTGSVSAAQSVSVEGKILLSFYELDAEDEAARIHLQDVTLESLGDFEQTVSVEGSSLIIRAINDRDDDGECSSGEAWAELEVTIADDDSVEPVVMTLSDAPCPAPAGD